MFDASRLYESELRALLDGESARVAVSCAAAFGADRLERSPEDLEMLLPLLPSRLRDQVTDLLREGTAAEQRDQGAWARVVDRVADALTGDLIQGDPDRWLGGIAASGSAGSWAHRLSRVLERATLAYCVVSDSRVVLAEHDIGAGAFRELASLPREAVVRARRAGRFLQRGRVVLDFADLSTLALMTGMVFTGPARRLVAALGRTH